MPKKPRQAHIPQQQPSRRRRIRRTASQGVGGAAVAADEPVFADEPAFIAPSSQSGPVDTRPRRRLELLARSQEQAVRVVPGQLPTYERSYLVRELKQITITSVSLLGVILALTFLLR